LLIKFYRKIKYVIVTTMANKIEQTATHMYTFKVRGYVTRVKG